METFLIRALQLILSFSILVIVHEGGHFFFARLFKIRVEKFYIFFDPWFALFKYKPKHSDTEYGVGWLPLGGYCKISGMIDESMDTEQMKKPPQPWEFRSKGYRTNEKTASAMGIPLQACGTTAFGNDRRSVDELHPCLIYLLHDSLHMGRFVHCPERYDLRHEV